MMNEKKSYEKPIIEIIEFLPEESIAASADGVAFYEEFGNE